MSMLKFINAGCMWIKNDMERFVDTCIKARGETDKVCGACKYPEECKAKELLKTLKEEESAGNQETI